MVRGTYVVEVSIPRQIRFLFGNGKAPSRRKGTGTSDKLLAETKVQQLCHQIYQEFSHNRKTAFLQLILSDIFKNTWHETQHNTADMG